MKEFVPALQRGHGKYLDLLWDFMAYHLEYTEDVVEVTVKELEIVSIMSAYPPPCCIRNCPEERGGRVLEPSFCPSHGVSMEVFPVSAAGLQSHRLPQQQTGRGRTEPHKDLAQPQRGRQGGAVGTCPCSCVHPNPSHVAIVHMVLQWPHCTRGERSCCRYVWIHCELPWFYCWSVSCLTLSVPL